MTPTPANGFEFGGEPLTPEETRKLRRIIRDQERMTWLWASLRIWAGWLSGIAVFVYGTLEFVRRLSK